MLDALKSKNINIDPKLKKLISTSSSKLTVVALKSGDVFVFQYSSSPPPNYEKMKSLKLITGDKIEGKILENVQSVITEGKRKQNFIKTPQGKLFV